MSNLVNFADIEVGKTALLVCDMQEKFQNAVSNFTDITKQCSRLTAAAKILDIPLIVTEQYPKGLGSTVPEIDISHALGVFPKTKFSMMIPDVESQLSRKDLLSSGAHVILCGVETHVCIQQTVTDILKSGAMVHVVADATSSRNPADRLIALERFRQLGAIVTTCEAVLLQLVGDKNHPKFKDIQTLIKDTVWTGLIPESKF